MHKVLYYIQKMLHRRCGVTDSQREGKGMKPTGIVRKVDRLGRVVLPIELRRSLDIAEGDEMEMFMEGDRIVLKKAGNACIFCANTRELVSVGVKSVCRECIAKLTKL